MKSVEELKAEQAKALATLQAEHEIAALAPIPPVRAMLVGTGERAWLTYEPADMWEALDIMRAFDPLPFNEYKGTFTRYEPEEVHERPGNKHKGEYRSGPYILRIETDGGEGFGPNAELRFFARLGSDIVSIHCSLRRPGYGPSHWPSYAASFQANERGRSRQLHGNRYIAGDFRASSKLSAMTDKVTAWGSGSGASWRYSYFIAADTESGEWRDAGLRLENIAEALHGPRPLFRFDFDTNAMTGVIVRLEDGKTSPVIAGDTAWSLRNATAYGGGREALEAASQGVEFN